MFIFIIYPIILIMTALLLKSRSVNYPVLFSVSLITSIFGFVFLVIITLDGFKYIDMGDTVFNLLLGGGILLYILSFICLLLHFIIPHMSKIMNANLMILRFLSRHLIIPAFIILLFTGIIELAGTKELEYIYVGYFASGLLILIYILQMIFKYTKSITTIVMWLFVLLSIVSFAISKGFEKYEMYTIQITNISVIVFFVILLIRIFKKLFR